MVREAQMARRYEVIRHTLTEAHGLTAGDVYVGFPYFLDPGSKANPEGKITLLYRENDGAVTDAAEYWNLLRELPGRVRIEFDQATQSWRAAGQRSKPTPRAKRFHQAR